VTVPSDPEGTSEERMVCCDFSSAVYLVNNTLFEFKLSSDKLD
jgi:hypothetical protein